MQSSLIIFRSLPPAHEPLVTVLLVGLQESRSITWTRMITVNWTICILSIPCVLHCSVAVQGSPPSFNHDFCLTSHFPSTSPPIQDFLKFPQAKLFNTSHLWVVSPYYTCMSFSSRCLLFVTRRQDPKVVSDLKSVGGLEIKFVAPIPDQRIQGYNMLI